MVIIRHYPHSAKHYSEADPFPGRLFALPARCPHPECQAVDALIRWGTFWRWACTRVEDYPICVQRIYCKVCERTHCLLPDFLHPHRQYVLSLLQRVVCLYILAGLSLAELMEYLMEEGPVRSTVREWITSFAHGAGGLLFDLLRRRLMDLNPLAELPKTSPPEHLDRVPGPNKRCLLTNTHRFWHLAEHLYAQSKACLPHLHFTGDQLLSFVLHWIQNEGVPPRLFWSPGLPTTPSEAF